jgi:arabinosyltransferase A/arabinosyltransferase B/arabinosyltransferase C
LPAPAVFALALVVGVLAVQVAGFARGATAHPGAYTLAADASATLRGDPCGLQPHLSVEIDPAAGALPAVAPLIVTVPVVPADIGGRTLPGVAVAGTGSTPWFALDPAQRSGELPVVVTVSGPAQPAGRLVAEFAAVAGGPALSSQDVASAATGASVDLRLTAPAGATAVRLLVDAPDVTVGATVASLPRVPRLTPMSTLLPPGSTAILDWPVAFAFGCLQPAPLVNGSAGLPEWRVAPPTADPSAGITYSPTFGGPFAAPRLLVSEQRLPVYLDGEPAREPVRLYRWVAPDGITTPAPTVTHRDVWGWHSEGRTQVPAGAALG